MIDDAMLAEWASSTSDYRLLQAIAEIRRLREEPKPLFMGLVEKALMGYAGQQVEAERDRILDEFSAALLKHGMVRQRQVYPFDDALEMFKVKQVEAFRERAIQAVIESLASGYGTRGPTLAADDAKRLELIIAAIRALEP